MTANRPMWLGRYPVTDADHVNHLETMAALHEFHRKLPRHQAEELAHQEYTKERLVEAAAHHLVGIKAATSAGDSEAAKKHGVMYSFALKALGHDPVGAIPKEVEAKTKGLDSKLYRFKPHPGDAFLLPPADKS